jgi:hypothetical protein
MSDAKDAFTAPMRYSDYVREERHLAAILFQILGNPENARQLLCATTGSCHAHLKNDSIALAYEYTEVRDRWSKLKRDDEAKRTAIYGILRRAKSAKFLLKYHDNDELIVSVEDFIKKIEEIDQNSIPVKFRKFLGHSNASTKTIETPGRWDDKKIFLRERVNNYASLQDAPCLIKRAFNIKPDLAILVDKKPLLVIELKWHSKVTSEKLPSGRKISQTELQRFVVETVLGYEDCAYILLSVKNKLNCDNDDSQPSAVGQNLTIGFKGGARSEDFGGNNESLPINLTIPPSLPVAHCQLLERVELAVTEVTRPSS